MKSKKVIGVFVSLATLFLVRSFFFYRESVDAKETLGERWKATAQNSDDSIEFMRNIDLMEAAETEEGRQLLERLYFNILNQLQSNYPEASDALSNAGEILRKGIEEGEITRLEVALYNRNLGVLDTVLYNFNKELRTDMDWYEAFSKEADQNSFSQAIEAALE
ncbi:hypothetical protein [Marinilactibacillus piezotolerans]|uniref:hypothetical protein n=1 Tax=Marinilactibacillus piezotolerans TaxID=258723 RepID=UPI0009B1069A|nr:hypothetical protein [Marinilactibacillus piezotolerans]